MIGQDDIQGHWQRNWLRAPGVEDTTTRVHWMQAGSMYADLRIPEERPELGSTPCLAALPSAALKMLARAEGFAGTTQIVDGICTWQRVINWHGATDQIDAGKLALKDGALIEDGVHSDYRELWQRRAEGPAFGQKLTGDGFTAYLVSVSDAFIFGAGRPDTPGDAPYDALFERVHALGSWVGEVGMADIATDPFLEGQPLLRRRTDGFLWHRINFRGRSSWVALT
ncbi:MAG: hypothetical protein AAGA70_02960 [Pseudomonadota bacterium]